MAGLYKTSETMKETDNNDTTAQSDVFWQASMARAFGRLEGKIDQLLTSYAIQKETTDDHEHRIRHLEKGSWKLTGYAAAIGSMGGGLVALLTKMGVWPL